MTLADRATIATWPQSMVRRWAFSLWMLRRSTYLRRTGRTNDEVDLVERYCKEQGLFRTDEASVPVVSTEDRALDLAPSSHRSLVRSGRRIASPRQMKQAFQGPRRRRWPSAGSSSTTVSSDKKGP